MPTGGYPYILEPAFMRFGQLTTHFKNIRDPSAHVHMMDESGCFRVNTTSIHARQIFT